MWKDFGDRMVDRIRRYAEGALASDGYGSAGESVAAMPIAGFDSGPADLSDWFGPASGPAVGGFGQFAPDRSEFFEPVGPAGPTGPTGGFMPPMIDPSVWLNAQGHNAD